MKRNGRSHHENNLEMIVLGALLLWSGLAHTKAVINGLFVDEMRNDREITQDSIEVTHPKYTTRHDTMAPLPSTVKERHKDVVAKRAPNNTTRVRHIHTNESPPCDQAPG